MYSPMLLSFYGGGGGFVNNNNFVQSSTVQEKAIVASENHRNAERRRRERINAHLATLRSLLPDSVKADKASLLGDVVRRVRDLQFYLATAPGGYGWCPCERDEVKVEAEGEILKVCVCCEDREGVVREVITAARLACGRVVKAEMGMVGGRTKVVAWVEGGDGMERLRREMEMAIHKHHEKESIATETNKRLRPCSSLLSTASVHKTQHFQ